MEFSLLSSVFHLISYNSFFSILDLVVSLAIMVIMVEVLA